MQSLIQKALFTTVYLVFVCGLTGAETNILPELSSNNWSYSKTSSAGTIQISKDNVIKLVKSENTKELSIKTTIDSNGVAPLNLNVNAKSPDKGVAFVYIVGRNKDKKWQIWSSPRPIYLSSKWKNISVKFYPLESTKYLEVVLASKKGTVFYKQPVLRNVNVFTETDSGRKKQEFWINMDYNDEVTYCHNVGYKTYEEKEIAAFFKQCKKSNVTGVLWRISVMGQVSYRSKAATVFPGRSPFDKLNKSGKLLAGIMKRIDPLQVAVSEARKNGIKIYVWVTISDEMGLNKKIPYHLQPEILIKHPEYSLLDKNGKPMKGTLCYSLPEVRKYRLDMIKELLAYKADGIYLCTRTHSFFHNTDSGYQYGYNKPIVEAYKKRYGKNILKEKFDKEKWLNLRAEGLDIFVKQAAELIHKSGQKLMFGLKAMNKEERGWPYGKARMNWKKWITSNWVDSVLVGHYLVSCHQILRDTQKYRTIAHTNQKIYFWGQMVHYQQKRCIFMKELEPNVIASAFAGANGTMYHEAINLEELKNAKKYFTPLKELYLKINSVLNK